MSLKDFHILFIICSIVLAIIFGLWAYNAYLQAKEMGYLVTAAGSGLAAVALTAYLIMSANKIKT